MSNFEQTLVIVIGVRTFELLLQYMYSIASILQYWGECELPNSVKLQWPLCKYYVQWHSIFFLPEFFFRCTYWKHIAILEISIDMCNCKHCAFAHHLKTHWIWPLSHFDCELRRDHIVGEFTVFRCYKKIIYSIELNEYIWVSVKNWQKGISEELWCEIKFWKRLQYSSNFDSLSSQIHYHLDWFGEKWRNWCYCWC